MSLRLASLAFGGAAVGRWEGRAVFVPFGAPGDLARVRVHGQHARWARAELLEVVEPGPARRAPPCRLAGHCGGCQWQHVDYSAQLAAKQSIVSAALRHVAPVPIDLLAAPAELHYRRRVRLHWQRGPNGLRLGFRAWRSRELVDVETCPLLVPELGRALGRLRSLLARGRAACGTLALLAGAAQDVHFSLRVERGPVPPGDACLGGGVVGGVVSEDGGAERSYGQPDVILDRRGLRASAACFAQANARQNDALVGHLRALLAADSSGRMLELYAGSGNLTAVLGERPGSLLAVESEPRAVALLQRNRALISAELEVREQPAAAAVSALLAQQAKFPLIVLDPPREGARELVDALAQLGGKRIVYVSCDPMTLARDLAGLARRGYRTTSVLALDTLPQTHHFEMVAALERTPCAH
ncbi:MAG: class I SAM-dependent RNA methyltransferase [Proteobacteria bacterium]|nr:class I SAM-dependent RNA methyltransferase [Pseudomonadota bacterium]